MPLWQRGAPDDAGARSSTIAGAVGVDGFSLFVTVHDLRRGGPRRAARPTTTSRREGLDGAELYVLMLLSASGGVVMASANDLIVMFLGLEILSIAVYVLAGHAPAPGRARRRPASSTSCSAAFSSAFFLYGIALVYGATGSTNLGRRSSSFLVRRNALLGDDAACCSPASRCCSSGFGFKVAAVPFHFWTPDVYQGAPTPVSGLHGVGGEGGRVRRAAAGASSSAFAAYQHRLAAGHLRARGRSALLVGAVLAVVQTDVKRMLAYSSISHAGFILVGVEAGQRATASRRRSSTSPPTRSWWPAASAS